MSAAYSVCCVSLHHAIHHHISSATRFQKLNIMDFISWTLIFAITIGFFVGLATLLGCLSLGHRGSCLLVGQRTLGRMCPEVTWGRTLKEGSMLQKGLPVNF
jgi:hypothetical protein